MTPSLAPLADAENVAKSFAVFAAALASLWAFLRFLVRPLFDETVLEAWKRKTPEVEAHMRQTIFRDDILARGLLRDDVSKALQLAIANATAIAGVGEQVHAAASLLSSVPALAAALEGVDDRLGDMVKQVSRNNDINEQNGRILAAHSALLGERRHVARRLGDPAPLPDGESGGDGVSTFPFDGEPR